MIDINKLTEADIGRYVQHTGQIRKGQVGKIIYYTDTRIFVRYRYGDKWGRFVKATDPHLLKFIKKLNQI